jgi:hypothetical protein
MKRISIAALLLLMLILGAEADVFERIGELLDKVEQGLGRIAPITTAVEIIKEGKQRKRNEHELNSMAEQDRFIGNFRATKIKSKAYGAFQLNKIDSTQMMAEYSRAAAIRNYYEGRAAALGVLARRQGRLNTMIRQKVTPIIFSKVAKTSRMKETFDRFGKTFSAFDERIEHLVLKAVALQADIDRADTKIIAKSRAYFDRINELHKKINTARNQLTTLGIHDRKLALILDKAQEATYAGLTTTHGVAEMSHELASQITKALKIATDKLKEAQDLSRQRGKEVQEFRAKAAQIKVHARPVGEVGRIVAKDPDYAAARLGFFEAFLKREGVPVDERIEALETRREGLQRRLAGVSDPKDKERRLIAYQIMLIDQRLEAYQEELESVPEGEPEERPRAIESNLDDGISVPPPTHDSDQRKPPQMVASSKVPTTPADDEEDQRDSATTGAEQDSIKTEAKETHAPNTDGDGSYSCDIRIDHLTKSAKPADCVELVEAERQRCLDVCRGNRDCEDVCNTACDESRKKLCVEGFTCEIEMDTLFHAGNRQECFDKVEGQRNLCIEMCDGAEACEAVCNTRCDQVREDKCVPMENVFTPQ